MKKATIKDVARRANVSISAVSYVMNGSTAKKYSEDTIRRIKEVAEELNYVPNNIARGMRSQKSFSLGIVNFWDINNRVFVQTLEGIVEQADSFGYSVVICPEDSNFSHIDYYKNKRVDGIIFISPVATECIIDEAEHIKRMKDVGVPFVIINGITSEKNVNYFYYNFIDTTFTATNYLISRGYKEISYVSPEISDSPELSARLEGYKKAMDTHSLKIKIYDIENVDEKVLKGFSAVVANKSDTAKDIMHKAIDCGLKIPQDFSLIAANIENYSEHLYTPLTCVQIPFKKIGKMSVERLMQNINEIPVCCVESPCCEIVEGNSVK